MQPQEKKELNFTQDNSARPGKEPLMVVRDNAEENLSQVTDENDHIDPENSQATEQLNEESTTEHNRDSGNTNHDHRTDSNITGEKKEKNKQSVGKNHTRKGNIKNQNGDTENKKNSSGKKKLALSIISILVMGGIAGGVYLYPQIVGKPIMDLVNFQTKKTDGGNLAGSEIVKLKQRMANVESSLGDVSRLETELKDMKTNIELLEKEVRNLEENLNREKQAWFAASDRRQTQIEQIQKRISDIAAGKEEVSRSEFMALADKLNKIEAEHSKSLRDMELKVVEAVKKARELRELKEKAGVKVKAAPASPKVDKLLEKYAEKEVTQIGHLKLVQIIPFGSQLIAQLTDGISGAMTLIEGDHLDKYIIEKITEKGVILKSPSGEKLHLVEG